jgi:hypothetical protein
MVASIITAPALVHLLGDIARFAIIDVLYVMH